MLSKRLKPVLESERMYVIGTAGHVDHGKSALVQALTGIDPDRLREEKERGLTIDLGFAWFGLDGQEVGIVDVPGHERFIKNMLAGVGGIDLALLVIAADEGVMPQTLEHLAIIDLLDVKHGVVAISKTDLVEPDFLELAVADVEEALKGTAMEGAQIVRCSARTGQGLNDLKEALRSALAATPLRRDIGRPRLPIDRAFTMSGFGTVVTGTLIDGSLKVGDEVEIVPAGIRSRVRGLQTHGRKVEVTTPGRRTAINLTGVPVDKIERGMLVTYPGMVRPSAVFDVRLRAVRYLGRPIRHNLELTFHSSSAEVTGRILLLDCDRVDPGKEAWAQIRLSEPVAALKGDGFIIRDPNDTLGGGRIVDTHAKRHRRFHEPTLAALEALAQGSPEEQLLLTVARSEPAEISVLARQISIDVATANEAVERLIAAGDLIALGPTVMTQSGFEALRGRLQSILTTYHEEAPLRPGMPREELRSRLGFPSKTFEQLIIAWTERGDIVDRGSAISLTAHEPTLNTEQAGAANAYVASLRRSRFSPASDSTLPDDVLAYLESRGEIVRVSDGIAFAADAYEEMESRIADSIRENGEVTLAEVRDMFGTSRKYAQALLEHMDQRRITRRVGDARVLR